MNSKTSVRSVVVTGLALFAMFFGAGNLIFPVIIGVESGVEQVPATVGFMLTGVLLPMAGMIAAATSSSGVLGIIERISHYPGLIYCWLIFLSTGMLYAIPRTGAASYSMSFQAAAGDSHLWLFVYTLVFFGIAGFLCLNPRNVLDRIGGLLTPALLVLLAVMIIAAVATMSPSEAAPIEKYASNPTLKGVFDGYGTLDAIASFVFGVVIIRALRHKGFQPGRQLFKVTAFSGVIAAFFLGIIYFGLSMVGSRVGRLNPEVKDGGEGLAFAAQYLFGSTGRIVFGCDCYFGLSNYCHRSNRGINPVLPGTIPAGISSGLGDFTCGGFFSDCKLGFEVTFGCDNPGNDVLLPDNNHAGSYLFTGYFHSGAYVLGLPAFGMGGSSIRSVRWDKSCLWSV